MDWLLLGRNLCYARYDCTGLLYRKALQTQTCLEGGSTERSSVDEGGGVDVPALRSGGGAQGGGAVVVGVVGAVVDGCLRLVRADALGAEAVCVEGRAAHDTAPAEGGDAGTAGRTRERVRQGVRGGARGLFRGERGGRGGRHGGLGRRSRRAGRLPGRRSRLSGCTRSRRPCRVLRQRARRRRTGRCGGDLGRSVVFEVLVDTREDREQHAHSDHERYHNGARLVVGLCDRRRLRVGVVGLCDRRRLRVVGVGRLGHAHDDLLSLRAG